MSSSFRSYVINEGLKLVFWIFWVSINGFLFYHTFMYYYTGPQFYYLHKMLGYGLCISRASAACINLNVSVSLLPMCKRSVLMLRSLTWIIGRQARRLLDRGKSFHIYCGYMLCVFTVVHCGAHAYNVIHFSKYYNPKYKDLNVAKYADQNPLLMLVTSLPGITGILLVVCVCVITVFATRQARKDKFDRFWKIHHLFIVFYILLFVHALDGVIKYQTNLDEHKPGCFMTASGANTTGYEPIVIPEPHPEFLPPINMGHGKKMAKKMAAKMMLKNGGNSTGVNRMVKKKMVANPINKTMDNQDTKQKEMVSKNQFMLPVKTTMQPKTTMMKKTTMSKTMRIKPTTTTMATKKTMNNKMVPKSGDVHHFIIPEPEPEPFNHVMKKDGSEFLMPEPHPSLDTSENTGSRINGVLFVECEQPPPVFKSCPKQTWAWLMVPLVLYIIERITRFYFFKEPTLIEFKQHPSHVFSLKFSLKNFKAKPGQIIWLKCPVISKVESHPFTLTLVPCDVDPTFEVHVKVLGDWTENLKNLMLEASLAPSSGRNNLYDLPPQRASNRDDLLQRNALKETTADSENSDRSNRQTVCHVTKYDQSEEEVLDIVQSPSHDLSNTQIQTNETNQSTDDIADINQSKSRTLNDACSTVKSKNAKHVTKTSQWPLICIEGPTGSAMQDIFKYETTLCVAGGIGVTPFAAVLNTLLKNKSIWTKMKLKRLYLVWVCKNIRSFEWFARLIRTLQIKLWNENRPDFLNVQLYLTSNDIEGKHTNHDIDRCRLLNGRPDLPEIFREIANKKEKSTIGVFCCGPHGLIKAVRKTSYQQSCKKHKFFFNKEVFS